jgi:hypothetical protein
MRRLVPSIVVVLVLGVGLGLAAARPAEAQGESPFTLKIGAGFPVGDTDEDVVFNVGAEYDLAFGGASPTAPRYSLSLDWMELGTAFGDVSYVPLLFNARWGRSTAGGRSFFYGVGLGILFADDDPELQTDSTNFAWQLFIGTHFNPQWRGEIRFVASENPGDDGVILLQVGYRL